MNLVKAFNDWFRRSAHRHFVLRGSAFIGDGQVITPRAEHEGLPRRYTYRTGAIGISRWGLLVELRDGVTIVCSCVTSALLTPYEVPRWEGDSSGQVLSGTFGVSALSRRDAVARDVLDALENPPPPNEALRSLAKRYARGREDA